MMSTDSIQVKYKIIYLQILIYVLIRLVEVLLCECIDLGSNLLKHVLNIVDII